MHAYVASWDARHQHVQELWSRKTITNTGPPAKPKDQCITDMHLHHCMLDTLRPSTWHMATHDARMPNDEDHFGDLNVRPPDWEMHLQDQACMN